MNAKKMLEDARHTVPLINSNMEIITSTLDLIKRVNDNPYSEYRSENVDKLIEYCERAIEKESKKFQDTVKLIGKLEDQKLKTILYLRYIENKTVGEVAEMVGLNQRNVFRESTKAFEELDEILKKGCL